MFRPKNLLSDPQGFLQEGFGPGIPAHVSVQFTQVIQAGRRVWMFLAKNFLPDPQRFLVERLGFGVVADLSGNEPEIIQGFSGLGLLRTSNALGNFNGSFRNRDRLLILTLFNQLIYLLI
jgi:hypothetical protein